VNKNNIALFMDKYFKHFNSKQLVEASKAYIHQMNSGNAMLISLAGAMSTAEIGKTLSKMIVANKVHAISCTGANLEEDIFNLIGKSSYKHIDNWRSLTEQDDKSLAVKKLNRVTDVCIPENVMLQVKNIVMKYWLCADKQNIKLSPYEFFYKIINSGDLLQYQKQSESSWLFAAAKKIYQFLFLVGKIPR